ncbi:MAG: hypothetical protein IKT25_08010 [Firmicutes bacterium]|nr:hypothetical protein [Bacillota bacterium]MBR6501435.1 hypothetical protein [Bacillota bacterium]
MKNEYNPNMTHQTTIYRRYQNAREGKNVYEELVKMAEGVKDLPIAPMDLASMIMDEVEDYEATWDMVYDEHLITGNVEKVMNGMFDKISALEPEKRMEVMNQMLQGFQACTDETNGDGSNEPLDYSPEAEKELQTKLKSIVSYLRISPAALERMKKQVLKNGNYMATAAAFRREGFALKCITAMDMYLTRVQKGENIVPVVAVLDTCIMVDMEAIADGSRAGECFELVATILIALLVFVATIYVISKLLEAKTVADAVLYALSGFGLVHIADKIEDPLVPTMGNLAVMGRHLIRRGTEALKEGFETMKEKLMNPQYDGDYFEEVDDVEFNQWDEMTDNMYVY